VGGRAHIEAAGKNAGGKAIWIIQGNDTVVEDIELSGCSVPDANGAGIRQEGRNLTVRRSSFHDNQNGILTGENTQSTIVIEDSEFANNGAGDGYSHNMYIGKVASFTLRGSYSHLAKVGHLVKSRALRNYILYNRLTDETGSASYELDLPQGGPSYVIGNVLQQAASTSNATFLSYARESERNPSSALWVVGNTFFNARGAGTFVGVAADVSSVLLRNNIFAGPGTVCDLASAMTDGNFVGDPMFASAATYDYSLQGSSPAREHGVAPGEAGGESLAPSCQYVHPAHAVARSVVGMIDQGAFEVGGQTTRACGSMPSGEPPALDASTPSPDAGADATIGRPIAPAVDASRAEGGSAAEAGPAPDGATEAPRRRDEGCALGSSTSSKGGGWSTLLFALTALLRGRRFRAVSRNA
jgi:hypothetical protein